MDHLDRYARIAEATRIATNPDRLSGPMTAIDCRMCSRFDPRAGCPNCGGFGVVFHLRRTNHSRTVAEILDEGHGSESASRGPAAE